MLCFVSASQKILNKLKKSSVLSRNLDSNNEFVKSLVVIILRHGTLLHLL